MADSPFANLGMNFVNWTSVPSLTETLASGSSPLLKGLGILLAGGDKKTEDQSDQSSPSLGQGIAPPSVSSGIGVNPQKSGTGISPNQFQMSGLTLPKLGTPTTSSQGVDLDGDGQVDNFWGIKK